tara:strand:+ start:1293 stop:1949 length:657 start_codon:yes stop_codon:yes gene_type:complete
MNQIKTIDLGFMEYQQAWDFQKKYHYRVVHELEPDTLIFVEHESVYTFGKNANQENLLDSASRNVKIFNTERGGEITYHGPGQLVCYPIINLKNYKKSVSWYMRSLEKVLIDTLLYFDIIAERKKGLTGVWVKNEKIGAQGVRMSRWVTMHGFALNVNTDLKFFDNIIPCGIQDFGVTSIEKIIGEKQDLSLIKDKVIESFCEVFQIDYNIAKVLCQN